MGNRAPTVIGFDSAGEASKDIRQEKQIIDKRNADNLLELEHIEDVIPARPESFFMTFPLWTLSPAAKEGFPIPKAFGRNDKKSMSRLIKER